MKNNTDLRIINDVPMMDSNAIASTTDKEPKHVVRDIKVMLERLGLYSPSMDNNDFKGFFIIYKEYCGRTVIDEIWLNEDLSMTLITGYDPKRRLALIEQWQEMKTELTQPRIAAPVKQEPKPMNKDILDIARVVAEATAGATMKAVMDVISQQVIHAPVLPTPEAVLITKPEIHYHESEFVPVIDLVWKFGLSDAACRRLASHSNLPTKLTNGERGYLLVHNVAFSEAFSCLIEESTPPTGKLKRWQHPDFGGFALKITEANKAAVEAKQ